MNNLFFKQECLVINCEKITFIVSFFLCIVLFSACGKTDTNRMDSGIDINEKELWLTKMNNDVISLREIVSAIHNEDSITSIQIDSNKFSFGFSSARSISFQLDNANYPAPLIGAHKIDDQYYWTRIVGTGTSATVLIKDPERSNYEIREGGVTPIFDIEKGVWIIRVEKEIIPLFDSEGEPFKAIGEKSLFKEVSFDIDSNVTIVTNEVPNHEYFIPRQDPLTLLLSLSNISDTLTIPAGFSFPIDFESSGVESFSFDVPEGWSVTYEFSNDKKGGVITVNAPTGVELDFEDRGALEIIAHNHKGKQLIRKVPIKSEVGLVNYASIYLADLPNGIEITNAEFTFKTEFNSTESKSVTAVRAGDSIRIIPPNGYPELYKANFKAEYNNVSENFDYYFEPGTTVKIGGQKLSIKPPKVYSYWQGGLLIHINEGDNIEGIESYKVTGKILCLHIAPKLPWFPNGNVDVSNANSETDGSSNTNAIINALGGIGTSANYIARWAVRVDDGGYNDWYLGAAHDYEIIADLRKDNESLFESALEGYGGDKFEPNTFWTSTNISATQARMYDKRYYPSITTGTKVYGANGLAFRDVK